MQLDSIWRMRMYVRPYLGQMVLMIISALLGTLAGTAIPLLLERLIDGPLAHGKPSAVLPLGALALALGTAEGALVFARGWTEANCAIGIETDLRRSLYHRLQRLPLSFHDRWESGQLLSRLSLDLSTVRHFIGFDLVFLVVNSITFLVVGTTLLVVYWPLGLVVLVLAAPLVLITMRFERRYRRESRRVQDQHGVVTTHVEESAAGIRTIIAFGRQSWIGARFEAEATALRDLQLDRVKTLAIWSMSGSQPQLVLALIVLGGSVAVINDALTLGALVAFVSLFLLLLWPIESLGQLLANVQEAASAADRLSEILDAPPEVQERPGTTPVEIVSGRLRFEGVGFSYPGTTTAVLRNVSFEVEPGEIVALVGAVGSGKTTLTALVPRLYDVTTGRITLDGHDLRDVPLVDLRRLVATVFQEPMLFSTSVRDNLTLSRPEASDQEILETLEVVQADFVHKLPASLDTRLGEHGMTLSAGQRQRLALARAVLGRPRVLVLDDPLSALDLYTADLVEEALKAIMASTSTLVVAHRRSTVMLADRVALLAEGTIKAVGKHSDLLATEPMYRSIMSDRSRPRGASGSAEGQS